MNSTVLTLTVSFPHEGGVRKTLRLQEEEMVSSSLAAVKTFGKNIGFISVFMWVTTSSFTCLKNEFKKQFICKVKFRKYPRVIAKQLQNKE